LYLHYIKEIYSAEYRMPSLTIDEVKQFSSFPTEIFVETGTFQGDTTHNVCSHFKKVYSIELNNDFANAAIQRFNSTPHVKIYQGDSSYIMPIVCKKLDAPTFFWLDGHWSGGDTARGEKDCPLVEELEQIMKHCKHTCIIAIDDARLFGRKQNEDWSSITRTKLLEIVQPRLVSCHYFPSDADPEDRMVLTLGPRT
jgi:hypothetical protein